MPNSIRDQVASLVKLQTIETEIDDIRSLVGSLPGKISALDDERKAFEIAMTAEGDLLDELKKTYRDQEREVQSTLSQMQKSQGKLNMVKNNKEYQSTLKEISDLRTLVSDIEDKMLENLDRVDAAEQSIAGKEEEFVHRSEQIKNDREHFQQKAEECREKLIGLENDRNDVIRIIDAEFLETFNALKGRQGGRIAVVSVSDSVCNGCFVNLPPQLYNELQRSDRLRFCPNCQRIIYWQE